METTLPISDEKSFPLPRQPDAQGFYIHCKGGFRAAQVTKEIWMIEPLVVDGQPCRKGAFSKIELDALFRRTGLVPIAFQSFGWSNGNYYSSWSPLISGQTNHLRGPSDLWGSLAANIAKQRIRAKFQNNALTTKEGVAKVIDSCTKEEALARSISLSLRSMDISVERIADFYNEQLVNLASDGGIDGRKFGSTQDQLLYAHVHSFFLHLGAARDFLGALIAARMDQPPEVDSMARLVGVMRAEFVGADQLLDLLVSLKFIQPTSNNPKEWKWFGWLKEASELRNQFVHRRPYGARHAEGFGHLRPIDLDIGLYRYVRPVEINQISDRDILDVIVYHYQQTTKLFQVMAEASGRDISIWKITDEDVVAVESNGT